MPSWTNDPKLLPGEEVTAARRTHVGQALMFVPGETSLEALIEFWGDENLAVVGGVLYRKGPDGALIPQSFAKPVVAFKPHTTGGDPVEFVSVEAFAQKYATIDTDETSDAVMTETVNELIAANGRINELLAELADTKEALRSAEIVAEDHLNEVDFLRGRLADYENPTGSTATTPEEFVAEMEADLEDITGISDVMRGRSPGAAATAEGEGGGSGDGTDGGPPTVAGPTTKTKAKTSPTKKP